MNQYILKLVGKYSMDTSKLHELACIWASHKELFESIPDSYIVTILDKKGKPFIEAAEIPIGITNLNVKPLRKIEIKL